MINLPTQKLFIYKELFKVLIALDTKICAVEIKAGVQSVCTLGVR
jgi:hypothetical protein